MSIVALLEKSGGGNAVVPAAAASGSKQDHQQKRTEYKKRLDAATLCLHCKKKHPNCTDDKCWELDSNATSHPAGWKLVYATIGRWCAGPQAELNESENSMHKIMQQVSTYNVVSIITGPFFLAQSRRTMKAPPIQAVPVCK